MENNGEDSAGIEERETLSFCIMLEAALEIANELFKKSHFFEITFTAGIA